MCNAISSFPRFMFMSLLLVNNKMLSTQKSGEVYRVRVLDHVCLTSRGQGQNTIAL